MSHENYSSDVRAQVFEVIVRQALEGAHWQEICSGPMLVNNITVDEIKAEVERRNALVSSSPSPPPTTPSIMDNPESEIPISGTRSLLVVILLLLLLVILALSVSSWLHKM